MKKLNAILITLLFLLTACLPQGSPQPKPVPAPLPLAKLHINAFGRMDADYINWSVGEDCKGCER